MKRGKFFQYVALGLATLGLCIPRIATAETTKQAPVVTDVILHQGGVLVGHVVTTEHTTVGNVQVALYVKDKQIATSTTDKNGRFFFHGLNNGVYEMAASNGRGVYRAWKENVAPPAAKPSALIVSGSDVVRGQQPAAGFGIMPLIVAGLAATAIAVPVAIHNSKSKAPVSGN